MRENTEVPAPPQDDSKPRRGLPNPDLNPMMNPTLGKNLGLWAQVYFTSPPEKREEAVQQLLRDLESGVKPEPIQASATESELSTRQDNKPVAMVQGEVTAKETICPACLHRNEPKQRFCGLCGFTLRSTEAVAAPAPGPAAVQEPPRNVERSPDDWGWLRDKTVAELQNSNHRKTPGTMVLTVVAVLVLAVVGYVFWAGRATHAPALSAPSDQHPGSALNGEPGTIRVHQPIPSRPAETQSETKTASTPEQRNSKTESDAQPEPSNTVPTEDKSEPVPPTQNGGKELQMAYRYLDGTAGQRNGEAAALWLWKAVKQKNNQAVLLLSDLYVKGEGVPQSCAQAKVLLSAAAKRGSSEARTKLREIISSGCR